MARLALDAVYRPGWRGWLDFVLLRGYWPVRPPLRDCLRRIRPSARLVQCDIERAFWKRKVDEMAGASRLVPDGGRWMRRVPHEHVCTPPLLTAEDRPRVGVGSQWACPCGAIFEIIEWRTADEITPQWRAVCGSVAVSVGHVVVVNPIPPTAAQSLNEAIERVRRDGNADG